MIAANSAGADPFTKIDILFVMEDGMNRKTFATAMAIAVGLSAPLWAGPGSVPRAHAATAETQVLAPDLTRDVQRSLNQKGYGVGAVDGVFGQSTRDAVARFQRDNSLPDTGQVDRQTLAALGITGLTARTETQKPTAPPGQPASTQMVQDVQHELQRLGYDPGRTDGVWGDRTRRALMEFQRDRHLATSGRIDEQTLAALEAGGARQQTGQLPPAPR